MPAHALLFDIGNVITFFDFTPAAQRLAAQSDATVEQVLSLLTPFKDDLESGRISDEDFITQSTSRIGFHGTREEFIHIWGDIFKANEPVISLVRKFAQTHPVYILSNTSGLHKDWLFKNFDVFDLFHGGIYSHEAGVMKPHDEIFNRVIKTYDLDPARTFYIDDLSDNIATGARLGFVTHHYHHHRHQELETALEAWARLQG